MPQADRFGDPNYGLTRHLDGVDFDTVVARTREALAGQGFGVLTEIDVKATLKKKLDVDWRRYLILGACNPPLAHKALSAEPGVGVLLPCNVVVAEDANGSVAVSAIDPIAMFSVIQRDDIEPLANEVKQKLTAALDAL